LGSTLADLKKPARDFLDAMRALVAGEAKKRKQPPERVTVTQRQLREEIGLPQHQVKRLLRELVELEHVEVVKGSRGQPWSYRLGATSSLDSLALQGLLTPDDLEKSLRRERR
jgi:DNA-binding IscR family transcriptional regulator